MPDRGLSFGAVAAAYERYRLDYPPQIADLVLSYADRPVRTALEIGAGTGKATRVFASRDVQVTATEPDPDMIDELRRHVPDSVRTVQATLETITDHSTYDLTFVAAAPHWTRAEGRWEHIAALLEPGGVFASFGGPVELADPVHEAALREACLPELPDDGVPSPDGTSSDTPMQWPGTELERSPQFTDVLRVVIERRPTVTTEEFVHHLSTVSAYLQLTQPQRDRVFARIRTVLPADVPLKADITVHLARRADVVGSPTS